MDNDRFASVRRWAYAKDSGLMNIGSNIQAANQWVPPWEHVTTQDRMAEPWRKIIEALAGSRVGAKGDRQ